MNKSLELLQKEAREKTQDFLPRHWEACQGWDGSTKQPIPCTCASGPVRIEMKSRLDNIIAHTYETAIKDCLREAERSKLQMIVDYYRSNRGSGHTYAAVNGVKNTQHSLLLVANEKQKQSTGLPRDKQISIEDRTLILAPRRIGLVIDNFALQEMFLNLRLKIQALLPNNK